MAREYFCAYFSMLDDLVSYSDEEVGRFFRAALRYGATGEEPVFPGNERYHWPSIKGMIDRDISSYEQQCEINRVNGAKGGRPKKQAVISETEKSQDKDKDKDEDEDEDKEKDISPSSKKSPAHLYGEYKHVRLTDAEYERLLADLGEEELQRCIRHIDESAQTNGNRNKWKDWNLVIRRCSREGWGLDRGKAASGSGKGGGRIHGKPVFSQEEIEMFMKESL